MQPIAPSAPEDRPDQRKKLDRFLNFLQIDNDNLQLLLDVLHIAVELGELRLASEIIAKHQERNKNEAKFNAIAGHIELALGRYESSSSFLNSAIQSGLEEPATFLNLAQCYNYLHEHEKATAILKDNPQLSQLFPTIYFPLYARLLHIADDSEGAIEQLELFHAKYELTAESAGLLSLLLFEANDRPELAMKLATEAIARNPNAAEALVARTSLHLDAGHYELAQRDIEYAVQIYPESGRAWSSKAQLEFAVFNFAAARDAAQNAVKYMNNHIGTWHLLGWAHLMLNELPEALDAFQQSYTLDRRFAETHGGLAAAYAHLGEEKLANNHIKLAEKLDPEGFAANYAKMTLLNKTNQSDKSSALFKEFKSNFNIKLGKSPQQLIEKRLFELSQQEAQSKNLH